MTAPVSGPEAVLPAFDSRTFRHVLGHFATGVAVITADGPRGPAAMVVSSFTSVSLEPPLVAFLPDKASTSWPEIEAAGHFAVNILSVGQEELCAQFARKGGDKFAGVTWHPSASGAPLLDGVTAWIDCELTQTFESGDHWIAVGRVLQLEAVELGATPLVFFQGGYQQLDLPPAAQDQSVPLGGVTVEELARVTGTDADSLVRYANSTQGLVEEIVGKYVRSFHAQCRSIVDGSDSAREAVAELLRVAFGSMVDNRAAIMILQNERPYLTGTPDFAYLETLERDMERLWNDTLQRGVTAGEFRDDLDVPLTYRFIRDVLFTAARWYSSGEGPGEGAAARAEVYRSLILHGLLG